MTLPHHLNAAVDGDVDRRDAPAQAPLPPVPQYSLPSSAEVHDRESPLALPTSGLYAGLDPAIVAALTGRPKPQQ